MSISLTSSASLLCTGVRGSCGGRFNPAIPGPVPTATFVIDPLFLTDALSGVPRSISKEEMRYANSSKGTSEEPSFGRPGVPLENSALLKRARNSSLLDSFIFLKQQDYKSIWKRRLSIYARTLTTLINNPFATTAATQYS